MNWACEKCRKKHPEKEMSALAEILDENQKTIIHITSVNSAESSKEKYEEDKLALPPYPPATIQITGVSKPKGEMEVDLSDEELQTKSKCSYHWVDQVVVGKRMSSKKTTSYECRDMETRYINKGKEESCFIYEFSK